MMMREHCFSRTRRRGTIATCSSLPAPTATTISACSAGGVTDVLRGRSGDYSLIGDITSLDSDSTARSAIMAVWLGKGSAVQRSNAIQTGTGVAGSAHFNNTTITTDSVLDVEAGDLGAD